MLRLRLFKGEVCSPFAARITIPSLRGRTCSQDTMQSRHSDPPRPDPAFGLKQALVINSDGSSPRRKHPRRQSLPARLSPPLRTPPGGDSGDDGGGDVVGVAGKTRQVVSPWPVPEHLAARQKTFYARVAKVCKSTTTIDREFVTSCLLTYVV